MSQTPYVPISFSKSLVYPSQCPSMPTLIPYWSALSYLSLIIVFCGTHHHLLLIPIILLDAYTIAYCCSERIEKKCRVWHPEIFFENNRTCRLFGQWPIVVSYVVQQWGLCKSLLNLLRFFVQNEFCLKKTQDSNMGQ